IGSLVRVPGPLQTFYAEVMRRKTDDHHASHSNAVNQLFHIVSSSAFLVCYALVFRDLTVAMWAGVAALFLRQIGHAVLEPPCHDKEAALLGYNTRNKTLILGAYLLIPASFALLTAEWTAPSLRTIAGSVAEAWLAWTLLVVGGRAVFLAATRGIHAAAVWVVKLVTDPLTDLIAYVPLHLAMARRPVEDA